LKTIRRPIIEKGAESIIKYLRDKFVEGKDDLVEDWALEMEKDDASYLAGDYMYNKSNYSQDQRRPANQPVGRELKLNEFQAMKQLQMQQYEEQKFREPDVNQAQANMQDYILQ
jgi:hypothetical protein